MYEKEEEPRLEVKYFAEELAQIYESLKIAQALEIETLRQIHRYERKIKAYEHYIEKLQVKLTLEKYDKTLKKYNNNIVIKPIVKSTSSSSLLKSSSLEQKPKREERDKGRKSKFLSTILGFFSKIF